MTGEQLQVGMRLIYRSVQWYLYGVFIVVLISQVQPHYHEREERIFEENKFPKHRRIDLFWK